MGEFRGYLSGCTTYGAFMRDNVNSLITLFAYTTIVLSAMQVGLATEPLANDYSFGMASYVFSIFSILAPLACIVAILGVITMMFVINLVRTLTIREEKRRQGVKVLQFFDRTFVKYGMMSGEPIELANLGAVEAPTAAAISDTTAPLPQYPRGIRLVLVTVGLILSIFLAALDSTIIATAIPSITTQFGSISNIAWYGSSYSITNTAFQSAWGKAYQYFNLKATFMCAIAVFEIGIMPWTSARVIGSFVGFASLFICFAVNEYVMGSRSMVQFHLFKNKLVSANLLYAMFLAGAFFPLMYTLPIQFQAVDNNTASQSGIRLIPLVMGVSVFTMISNGLLTFWRHYKPFFLLGALFAVIGNTKIHSLDASTPIKDWVGFELLTAMGVGLALQIPMIANQALVPAEDLGAATSMSLFMENCGTVLFVASGEAAFTNGLLSSLARNLPQVDAKVVLDAGATQIRALFSGHELEQVLGGYLDGCKTSHIVTVACGAMAAAISLSNAGPAAIKELKKSIEKSHER
ncbi:unnamed protein product [Alternaria alternata]